ncbi:MAG: VWA domain-containing protein [Candidatus Acidiferrales bacterium]
MNRQSKFMPVALFVASILCIARPLAAQSSTPASPDLVHVTVTAMGRSGEAPARLERVDVSVHQDKQPRPVVDLISANGENSKLELVILIDQSSNARLGSQFKDVAGFIRTLPQNAAVGIAYAMNGSARMQQPLTTDREAAARALRLTTGAGSGQTSVYEAFRDLVKNWPDSAPRREVLLISDGIDPTYGFSETVPGRNPSLEKAIQVAQRENITVFSIFEGTSGRVARNRFLNNNGQGSLSELTSDSGGYAFFQGTQNPISFRPFLQRLTEMLGRQYILTFRAALPEKPGYRDLKVSTEVPHVKLLAPNHIYLPSAK